MSTARNQQAGYVSPTLTSWVDVSPDTDFPIQNLPLLLLTTWTEYDPTLDAVPLQAYELVAGHLRRLDLSENLTSNRALLVGFTREPGPARLCVRPGGKKRRDFEPIEPSEARTMFRISLPVR